MPDSRVLIFSVLLGISCVTTGYAQSLLSNQETSAMSDWLDSAAAFLPENTLPRAILQQYLRGHLTLNFVAADGVPASDSPMALLTRAVQCADLNRFDYCTDNGAVFSWIQADSNNLTPYLLLTKRTVRSNEESALTYLLEGLQAGKVDSYYFPRFMALREVLREIGILPGRRNFIAELLLVPSLQEIYGSLISICTARVAQSQEWAEACLRLADKLETGETFYANVLGAAIRRDVVPLISSDEAEIAVALERRATYDQVRQQAQRTLDWWTNPEGRPESWYRDSLEIGELAALRKALEQAGN
ncbi:MAG: hypothetical protein RL120_06125 [Gammaproteobacteria bacterium]